MVDMEDGSRAAIYIGEFSARWATGMYMDSLVGYLLNSRVICDVMGTKSTPRFFKTFSYIYLKFRFSRALARYDVFGLDFFFFFLGQGGEHYLKDLYANPYSIFNSVNALAITCEVSYL